VLGSRRIQTKADPLPTDTLPEAPSTAADPQALLRLIQARLDDDQAQDVVTIDLENLSPLADFIVIASGRSQRHVSAVADHLLRALKDGGFGKASVEGLPQADWVLIDAGDVIVHLFRPEVRAFYQIEKIWSVDTPSRHRIDVQSAV
jgi:ribosome-associated protein